MGIFSGKDERENGELAKAARDLMGEGGSARVDRTKPGLYSHANVTEGPITSIIGTIRELRKGR